MEANTHNGQAGYHDGESIIIGAFTDEGLPVLLPPADQPEAPKTNIAGSSLTTIVENLESGLA